MQKISTQEKEKVPGNQQSLKKKSNEINQKILKNSLENMEFDTSNVSVVLHIAQKVDSISKNIFYSRIRHHLFFLQHPELLNNVYIEP